MNRPRLNRASLSTRVMAFVAITVGASFALCGWLVEGSIERHFADQDIDELYVMTNAVAAVLQSTSNTPASLAAALPHAIAGHHGVYYLVSDAQGRTLYQAPGANLEIPSDTLAENESSSIEQVGIWYDGDRSFRGAKAVINLAGQRYSIVTAIDISFHRRFLEQLRWTLWLIMTGAGAITLLAGWYGVHQGHAPLRKLGDNMRSIQTDRLDVRMDPDSVPKDLQGLVLAFNAMIGQLESSFERLTNFTADIAHELRTPLTNLITQTQVALNQSRTVAEYRELLYQNLEEQEHLARMVRDMLWLAKSDHGLITPVLADLRVGEEVGKLFEFFEALADERQVSLVLQGEDCSVRADRDLLRQVLSNLLSNAIRHTPKGNTVTVRVAKGPKRILVSVCNPGERIAVEHLVHIFERFYRTEFSRNRHSDGAGLGLAIAKSIVELHGGGIDAASTDGETTFSIWLPENTLIAAERLGLT